MSTSGRDDYMHTDDVAGVEEAVSKLRSSHDWLVREFEALKKRHEGLVEYNNEVFSEAAHFRGLIHEALGYGEDEDFHDDATYVARLKAITGELWALRRARPTPTHGSRVPLSDPAARPICGATAPLTEVTVFRDDVTCPACLAALAGCVWCGSKDRDLENSEDGLECEDKEACLVDIDARAKATDR